MGFTKPLHMGMSRIAIAARYLEPAPLLLDMSPPDWSDRAYRKPKRTNLNRAKQAAANAARKLSKRS